MTTLCKQVLAALAGKTLATAESCTGGGIGQALTAVPGASQVYKGGIVSYCNEIKHRLLAVPEKMLETCGAVSAPVAEAMAEGARKALRADVAVSVTGLAGPSGDEFGNAVGTVFIGYADEKRCFSKKFVFPGERAQVRHAAIEAALRIILEENHGR